MKILVVGGAGMLGSDVVPVLKQAHEVIAPSSQELDITEPESIAQISVGKFGQLDWCINCAAYTAVDKAESEVRAATELNAIAPGYLAQALNMAGCKMIHLSTDFVFDGDARSPYLEDAPTGPLGVYGETKLEGERNVMAANPNAIILRTSWLYGPVGHSFPKSMIRAWEAGKTLRVVADQTGSPTYTLDLAGTISAMIERNVYPGIYHATGPEAMTWYDFARVTLETWKEVSGSPRKVSIEAIPTDAWPTAALRPTFSVLSTEKLEALGIGPMRTTTEAIVDFCRRLDLTA